MSAASAPLPRILARVDARTVALALAALGLLVRLLILRRDLDMVDRLFIPDDTYYTLSIARSLAHGLGPSVDGVHPTSGFQPLLAFLLAPVYAVTKNPDAGLRVSLLIGAICDVGSALLLGRLAYRFAGRLAGVLAVGFWALSPIAVAQSMNGLETSLALFLSLAFVELWLRADERGAPPLRYLVPGVVAGLALLARIDAAFVVVAVGAVGLIRGRRAGVGVAAAAAAVVVGPWWIYCTVRFGSPLPESGAAVRAIASIHRAAGQTVTDQLARAAGSLLGAPLVSSRPLRTALTDSPLLAVLAWVGLVAAVGWRLRRRASPYALALAAAGVGLLVFYTFLLPAPWFYGRYLAPAAALLTLPVAAAASWAWRASRARLVEASLVLGAIGLLALIGVGMTVPNVWREPPSTPDHGLEGAKGYRVVARIILNATPDRGVIGSLQSGALAYYGGGRRVVNLDGVVDHEAGQALRQHRLGAFARSRGVGYFADWGFNEKVFLDRAGPGGPRRLVLSAEAPPQGDETFALYRIVWP